MKTVSCCQYSPNRQFNMSVVDIVIQVFLSVLSLSPIALAQAKSLKVRRYDCIAGLVAQPFLVCLRLFY